MHLHCLALQQLCGHLGYPSVASTVIAAQNQLGLEWTYPLYAHIDIASKSKACRCGWDWVARLQQLRSGDSAAELILGEGLLRCTCSAHFCGSMLPGCWRDSSATQNLRAPHHLPSGSCFAVCHSKPVCHFDDLRPLVNPKPHLTARRTAFCSICRGPPPPPASISAQCGGSSMQLDASGGILHSSSDRPPSPQQQQQTQQHQQHHDLVVALSAPLSRAGSAAATSLFSRSSYGEGEREVWSQPSVSSAYDGTLPGGGMHRYPIWTDTIDPVELCPLLHMRSSHPCTLHAGAANQGSSCRVQFCITAMWHAAM